MASWPALAPQISKRPPTRSALIDGSSVSFRQEGHELIIEGAPDADFLLEIRNTCCPEKNTALSGLYTSGGSFFTQCEAEGFRRITYFLDRPDVMAVYTVTLRADKAKYPVLLSNGNLVETSELDNGRHLAKWHDPYPKPSYLFALVAGDLVAREQRIRTRGGKDHLLQVYVRQGDLEKTEHAMNSLIASVVWDEARFKLPLDIFGEHIGFKVNAIAQSAATKRRDRQCMRDQGHAEPVGFDVDNCKADAIESGGAFAGDLLHVRGRNAKPHRAPIGIVVPGVDDCDGIDMPGDKMPADWIAGAQRPFDVHEGPWHQLAQVGSR